MDSVANRDRFVSQDFLDTIGESLKNDVLTWFLKSSDYATKTKPASLRSLFVTQHTNILLASGGTAGVQQEQLEDVSLARCCCASCCYPGGDTQKVLYHD